MKPIILQLGGIGSSSAASSSSSPSSSSSSPSSISSPSSASSSASGLQAQERTPRDVAVDLSVLGNKKVDSRPNMMTTVVTNNAMADQPPQQHPHHSTLPPHHRNSSSSHGSSMSKSITRLLQHSILQLCNEHIGYTHKLQILGVLCMTVDDEQQELVVKVNNTLKRVGPVTGPKDAVHLAAAGMPPSVQTLTSPPTSHPHVAAMSHHHPHSHHHQHHAHHSQQHHHQGTDLSLTGSRGSSVTRDEPRSHPSSPAPSPVPLNMSGRKSHGRKGSNPTKVQQVVEENPLDTDDDDEEEEEPLTIMPEAPEATMGRLESGPPSPASSQPTASSTPTSSGKYRAPSSGPSGSAKRKPSHQFRVPQYPSPAGSPYIRTLPNESAGSPYTMEEGTDPSGASSTGRGATGSSSSSSSSSSSAHGISLPIYVAGTYSAHDQDGEDQPINLAAGSSASNSVSPSLNSSRQQNGLLMNGRDSREGSPACSSANGERPGSTSSMHQQRVKDEPDEDSESEYKEHLTSLEEYARANVAALFSPADVADRDARMEGLHAALPYSGIGMYLPRQRFDSPSPSRLEPGTDRDGLSIKYTSTGPYTVGANGKDVSNSSRIKDIIMYDDQSPLSAQKGARIETDYIVDKLGMDGRKRRRRAPEDLLTPEEIAEYLGQPERSDFNFRCKYCSEEFDSITRYIHHTLAAHQAYICHQCGKSFTTKSSLLRHRPIHTGMRRFACSICKKTFYRKDKCKAHIRRHLGLPSGSAGQADADSSVLETSAPLVADPSSSSQFPSPVEAVDVDSP